MTRYAIVGAITALGLYGTAAGADAPDFASTIAATLRAPVARCGAVQLVRNRLVPYYRDAAPAALWLDRGGPTPRARALRRAIHDAEQQGLDPASYGLEEIDARWASGDPADRTCLELLLTAGYDRYSRDVRSGLLRPHDADPTWQLRPAAFDPVAALQDVRGDEEFAQWLANLPPVHRRYEGLVGALQRYRQIVARGGWPPLPDGPPLEPGETHDQVPALRARLRSEGDLAPLALSVGMRYDTVLATAVEQFQRRHGLQEDGVVGARTRAALNVPATERAAQLRRAMERLRWLPRDFGSHYVFVNTAAYELRVIENGRTVVAMRAINGTRDQATPSFTATLQSMIINPYWYVPERIARDRLWPRQWASPQYFASRGFRVYDTNNGHWQEINPGRVDRQFTASVRVRQDPGPQNLMGRLSFVFPNPFDIFLHDTPDRALFAHTTRSFSEGCIRIEDAMALALHTLRRKPEWSAARIQSEIDALHHHTVPLPEPMPVYVLYLPSWVDDRGHVQFREDPYQREAALIRAFPGK